MPLRVKIKNLIKKLFPEPVFKLILTLWRITGARFFTGAKLHDTYLELFKTQYGSSVTAGPFQGLKYVDMAAGSTLLLKLIGGFGIC